MKAIETSPHDAIKASVHELAAGKIQASVIARMLENTSVDDIDDVLKTLSDSVMFYMANPGAYHHAFVQEVVEIPDTLDNDKYDQTREVIASALHDGLLLQLQKGAVEAIAHTLLAMNNSPEADAFTDAVRQYFGGKCIPDREKLCQTILGVLTQIEHLDIDNTASNLMLIGVTEGLRRQLELGNATAFKQCVQMLRKWPSFRQELIDTLFEDTSFMHQSLFHQKAAIVQALYSQLGNEFMVRLFNEVGEFVVPVSKAGTDDLIVAVEFKKAKKFLFTRIQPVVSMLVYRHVPLPELLKYMERTDMRHPMSETPKEYLVPTYGPLLLQAMQEVQMLTKKNVPLWRAADDAAKRIEKWLSKVKTVYGKDPANG